MRKELKSGIYCIENMFNGKRSIGKGKDVGKRMRQKHYNCIALLSAIKKYGKENFKRYIILYCEIEEMGYYEIECIKIFHSRVTENGYNISLGGISAMTGRTHSEKTIEKMRIVKLGKHPSEETRKKLRDNHADVSGENNPMFGKPRSDESKEKMRGKRPRVSGENNPNFGKHPSDETRRKQSLAKLGKYPSDETKGKISVAMSGENNHMFGKTGENSPLFGKKRKNASSKYFGVSKQGKSWKIRTRANGKNILIGYSKDEIEAAKMYDRYVIKNNLPNPLNFPED